MHRIHPLLTDFAWTRLGNPALTPGQVADKGRRSLRRIQSWDVALPPGNRLECATEALERCSETPRFHETASANAKCLVGESARSVMELYLATHCRNERPNDLVCSKFCTALGGRLDDPSGTPCGARDVQFELYVWGLFNAGRTTCEFAEPPDLTFAFGKERAGIAVKRLWSPEQARKRLSKAADQIEAAGVRGLVAINAQEYLTTETTIGELPQKAEAFNRALARLHGHLPYVARKERLLGLLLCGTAFSSQSGGRDENVVDFTMNHQIIALPRDDAEEAFINTFFDQQRVALQAWMRNNL